MAMYTATLSSKFQLSIPKGIREELRLESGQKFSVIAKGDVITLVPIRQLKDVRGIFKGADPEGYRDRKDRF
jgi:AbrB family looped-hinge helix DNA binding protein